MGRNHIHLAQGVPGANIISGALVYFASEGDNQYLGRDTQFGSSSYIR